MTLKEILNNIISGDSKDYNIVETTSGNNPVSTVEQTQNVSTVEQTQNVSTVEQTQNVSTVEQAQSTTEVDLAAKLAELQRYNAELEKTNRLLLNKTAVEAEEVHEKTVEEMIYDFCVGSKKGE